MAILKDTTVQGNLMVAGGGTFSGKEILTIEQVGTNYLRYTDGTQICWGVDNATAAYYLNKSFPISFKSGTTPTVSVTPFRTSEYSDSNYCSQLLSISNTSFNYKSWMLRGTGDKASWMAIGKWK